MLTNPYSLHGTHLVRGLLVEKSQVHRLIHQFEAGCRLIDFGVEVALLWPKPRLLCLEQMWSMALIENNGILSNVQLSSEQIASFQTGSLVLLQGGTFKNRGVGRPLDLEELCDMELKLVPVHALCRPIVVQPAVVEETRQGRAFFSKWVGELPSLPEPTHKRGSWFSRLLMRVIGAAQPAAVSPKGVQPQASSEEQIRQKPPSIRPFSLSRWMSSVLSRLGLSSLLDNAHQRYLDELMADLKKEDLTDALKKAIPIDGEGQATFNSFFFPTPREDLTYSSNGGAGPALGLKEQALNDLRRLYEQACERLVRQGKIEEAAFVTAELLNNPYEAVALLEAHERFQTAAELAEAKALGIVLVVRLWFLAGEVSRAMTLARSKGAFVAVLAHLKEEDDVRLFRTSWATTLAAAGDYSGAISAMSRPYLSDSLLREWLCRGVEQGGASTGRLMGLLVAEYPDQWELIEAELSGMLSGDDVLARLSFASEIVRARPTPLRAMAARAVCRSLLLESTEVVSPAIFESLHSVAGGAFFLDRPKNSVKPPTPELFELHVGGNDHGLFEIVDALLLPSGQLVLALGEAGVVLVSLEGTILLHLGNPVHHLVSAAGKVLLITDRGAIRRLSWLDVKSQEVLPWVDCAFSHFVKQGTDRWFVVENSSRLLAIDLLAEDWRSLWSTSFGKVHQLQCSEQRLSVLVSDEHERTATEVFSYRIETDISLRHRKPINASQAGEKSAVFLADQEAEVWVIAGDGASRVVGESVSSPLFIDNLVVRGAVRVTWGQEKVYLSRDEVPIVEVMVLGADHLSCRLDEHRLVVFDRRGRLLVIGTSSGCVLANLRI